MPLAVNNASFEATHYDQFVDWELVLVGVHNGQCPGEWEKISERLLALLAK